MITVHLFHILCSRSLCMWAVAKSTHRKWREICSGKLMEWKRRRKENNVCVEVEEPNYLHVRPEYWYRCLATRELEAREKREIYGKLPTTIDWRWNVIFSQVAHLSLSLSILDVFHEMCFGHHRRSLFFVVAEPRQAVVFARHTHAHRPSKFNHRFGFTRISPASVYSYGRISPYITALGTHFYNSWLFC